MRQPSDAFGRISCPLCSRSSHLESGALFPLSLFLAVIVPGVLGIAEEYGNLDFSGDVHFCGCNALFDSGYMLCVSTLVALGRISHIFYVAADSNPEVLLGGAACPVDASGCSFALRSSHLENWKFLSSFTWLTRVMMGAFFAAQCGMFRPPLRS